MRRFLYHHKQLLVAGTLLAALLVALFAGAISTRYLSQVFLAIAAVIGTLLGGILLFPLLPQKYRPDVELPFAFHACFEPGEATKYLLVEGEREDLGHRIAYIPRGCDQIDNILARSVSHTTHNAKVLLGLLRKLVPWNKSSEHKTKSNVLIVGNECAGKTRELVELVKRHVRDDVSALIYEPGSGVIDHHGDIKAKERVLVIVDDLHDRCGQFPDFLDNLDNFVETRLRRKGKDVQMVVTSLDHPSALEIIEWPRHKFWRRFHLVCLGFLTQSQFDALLDLLSEETGVQLSQEERRYLSKHRTGTFKLIISLFELEHEDGHFATEDWEWYKKGLAVHWHRFREDINSRTPQAEYMLRSIDVLNRLGLPLYQSMVVQLATEWGGKAGKIRRLMSGFLEYAFPRGDSDDTFVVFNGQVATGWDPEHIDDILALTKVIITHLDSLGVESAFVTIQEIESKFCPPAQRTWLWEKCLDEVSRKAPSSLSAVFFRARVEYYLDIVGDALQEYGQLIAAAMDRPEVLLEAARVRFALVSEVAKHTYERDREDAEDEYVHAEEYYSSLVETASQTQRSREWMVFGSDYVDKDGKPQEDWEEEIRKAKRVRDDARQRLRNLNPEVYYQVEIQDALDLALRAQRLGADNSELHQLIAEMRRELGE